MRIVKTSTVVVAALFVVGVAVTAVVIAQSGRGTSKAPALTAMDYIQIKQLANRFAFAVDTAADNGCEFADLFTPDGEFQPDQVKGRDRLAALARLAHGLR